MPRVGNRDQKKGFFLCQYKECQSNKCLVKFIRICLCLCMVCLCVNLAINFLIECVCVCVCGGGLGGGGGGGEGEFLWCDYSGVLSAVV